MFLLLAFSKQQHGAAGAPWAFSAGAISGYFEPPLAIEEIRELTPAETGGRWMIAALMRRA
jgi:hypothetical protein